MTAPTIRPASGLWAAVSPEGEIIAPTISDDEDDAAAIAYFAHSRSRSWGEMQDAGWRIIRVDVIPHEDPARAMQSQENE